MLKMIDLYSGLGGASEAMCRSTDWMVRRIENNPELAHIENTCITDVKEIAQSNEHWWFYGMNSQDLHLLWASPPCLEFSQGYNAPGPKAKREGRHFEPSLELLESAIKIRDMWKPRYWAIENVIGSIKHFEPLLGEPTQIIGSFVIWTNLPQIIMPRDFKHSKEDNPEGHPSRLRANYRALVPYDLSNAVRISAEAPTLGDYQ